MSKPLSNRPGNQTISLATLRAAVKKLQELGKVTPPNHTCGPFPPPSLTPVGLVAPCPSCGQWWKVIGGEYVKD